MRLTHPLLRLPIDFDAEWLAAEVQALEPSAWDPHPTGFIGNEAVRLVTPHGQATDDLSGPMAPTEHLLRCPYILQVMAELGGVWGRSRLMGLAPGSEVPAHVDIHYYWRTHLRIHIPVITNPGVRFTCGDETVHMRAGECWVFDSFRRHDVQNKGTERRIHLVLDTVGGERLWDLIDAAQSSGLPTGGPRKLRFGDRSGDGLVFEQVNIPKVMSPWEIRCHIAFLAGRVLPHPQLEPVMKRLDKFADAWGAAWARFGPADEGLPAYRELIATIRRDLNALRGGGILLENDKPLYLFLEQVVFIYAVTPLRADKPASASAVGGERLAS